MDVPPPPNIAMGVPYNDLRTICRREREYKVVIKFVARANMHHLGQFLSGKRADAPQEALQILDIVLRELSTKR